MFLIHLLLACPPAAPDDTETDSTVEADTDADADADTDTDTDADTDPLSPTLDCSALPAGSGSTVSASPGDDLPQLLATLSEGDTLSLADGTYDLNGDHLWIDTPGVTLRGASQDAGLVILDGGFTTTEIVTIAASGVTLTDLTLHQAWTHGVHVIGGGHDAVLHRIVVSDPGQQAIKVNQSSDGTYADRGALSCSTLTMTSNSRDNAVRDNCYTGGVDMHQTSGWLIRDNHIEGFWCTQGLSEHGIHMWRANADTRIVRNTVVNCARGIGIGLVEEPIDVRDHGIEGCDQGATYYDDVRGSIVNNVVIADDPQLFASASGFDSGVGVYAACDAVVAHNTVYSTQAPFSSIEWRFEATNATVTNNLVSHNLRERTPGTGTLAGNLEGATAADFVGARDMHLVAGSAAVDAGVASPVTQDVDGDPRDTTPDVGADEL
jgi:hypothetical protein